MFVSFIQFSFDPYLDQFEARQDQAGPDQAWRTEDESHCVVSGLSSLSLIPSPIHLLCSDGMLELSDTVL